MTSTVRLLINEARQYFIVSMRHFHFRDWE